MNYLKESRIMGVQFFLVQNEMRVMVATTMEDLKISRRIQFGLLIGITNVLRFLQSHSIEFVNLPF